MASALCEPITGMGAGPRVRAPGQVVPWSWRRFNVWMSEGSGKIALFSVFLYVKKCAGISLPLKNW